MKITESIKEQINFIVKKIVKRIKLKNIDKEIGYISCEEGLFRVTVEKVEKF